MTKSEGNLPNEAQPGQAMCLPGPVCCGRSLVGAELVECMVPRPHACKFAMSFGNTFFCQNPQRASIIRKGNHSPDVPR